MTYDPYKDHPLPKEPQCPKCGGDHPYRVQLEDPYDDLKNRLSSLAEAVQERLAWRDEEYKRLERRVENHFRADVILIILLMVTGMCILRFWIGVGH